MSTAARDEQQYDRNMAGFDLLNLPRIGIGLPTSDSPTAYMLEVGTGAAGGALRVDSVRNVVVNNGALATAATDGFLFITRCAGTPTGVPNVAYTPTNIPLQYDATNDILYAYRGSWKAIGGASTVTGSGAATQVTYWSAANVITGEAGFTWTTTTGVLLISGTTPKLHSTTALTVDAGAALNLGTTAATSVAVGRSGITTTVTGGLSQLTGAVSLAANAASSFTTSAGALTLTAAAASTWSTAAGALTITSAAAATWSAAAGALTLDAAAALNLGTTNATSIAIGNGAIVTAVTGVLRLGTVSSATGTLSFANSASALLTTFQAGNATAAVTYTLPTAGPTSNGDVLASTTAGVMSWATPSTITGSGTATRVTFWSGTSAISSSANLYWDDASRFLGIGSGVGTTPETNLTVSDTGSGVSVSGTIRNNSATANSSAELRLKNSTAQNVTLISQLTTGLYGLVVGTGSASLELSLLNASTTGAISFYTANSTPLWKMQLVSAGRLFIRLAANSTAGGLTIGDATAATHVLNIITSQGASSVVDVTNSLNHASALAGIQGNSSSAAFGLLARSPLNGDRVELYTSAGLEFRLRNIGSSTVPTTLYTNDLHRMSVLGNGNVGIGSTANTANTTLDVRLPNGATANTVGFQLGAGSATAVSDASSGRIIFNQTTVTLKASLGTAAYVDIITASAGLGSAIIIGSGAAAAGGTDPIALGVSASSAGTSAVSLGKSASAGGNFSVAVGASAASAGAVGSAFGASATASGTNATAIGQSANCNQTNGTALGSAASVAGSGARATALGYNTVASGADSLAAGSGAAATGTAAVAIGLNAAAGANACVIGATTGAIESFIVQGATLQAIKAATADASADGLTSLTIIVHDGGAAVAKAVKAASGVASQRILYVDD